MGTTNIMSILRRVNRHGARGRAELRNWIGPARTGYRTTQSARAVCADRISTAGWFGDGATALVLSQSAIDPRAASAAVSNAVVTKRDAAIKKANNFADDADRALQRVRVCLNGVHPPSAGAVCRGEAGHTY